ncbi:MAG TPA: DedA family protein [Pirellulales bacterium]|nr:DedA family protein [Pirellulales bacterium]
MLEVFLHQVTPYLAVAGLLILTGMGLPIPEEVFVISAGIAAHNQHLEPWLALATCLVGAIIGDCAMYAIGYHFGHGLLRDRHWFARYMTPEREQRVEEMIHRHGFKVFLTARFLVGVRSPVYITAGILRMPFRRFILVDAFCASLVVTLFFGLSFVFAEAFESLWNSIRRAEIWLTATLGVAALGVLLYFVFRRRRRLYRIRLRRLRRKNKGSRPSASEEASAQESKSVA